MTGINIPGGIMEADKLPNEIINFLYSKLKQGYSILNITNVRTQVVSGIIYYFDIRVLDGGNNNIYNYNMSIWSQPWLNPPYKIQSITPFQI